MKMTYNCMSRLHNKIVTLANIQSLTRYILRIFQTQLMPLQASFPTSSYSESSPESCGGLASSFKGMVPGAKLSQAAVKGRHHRRVLGGRTDARLLKVKNEPAARQPRLQRCYSVSNPSRRVRCLSLFLLSLLPPGRDLPNGKAHTEEPKQ